MACPSYGGGIRFAHDFDKEKIMALETSRPRTRQPRTSTSSIPSASGAGHRAGAGREEFWQRFRNATGRPAEQNVEVIPTGSLALDMALGIGGLPKGRIVEIYGPESSG